MSPTFAELYESDQEPFRALAIEFLEAKAIVGFYVPAGHDHRFGLMASIKFMRDGDDDNNIAHSEWEFH